MQELHARSRVNSLDVRCLLTAVWQVEVAPTYMAELGVSVAMMGDELREHFTHFINNVNDVAGKTLEKGRPSFILVLFQVSQKT